MPVRLLTIYLILFLWIPLHGQSSGFYDDFEDGKPDTTLLDSTYLLWKADHPRTFGLTESEGLLNISYTRTTGSEPWDNFNFTPPSPIDVGSNPFITLKIRSDVAHTFTVKPIYTNGNSGWIEKEIPADEAWHSYSFELSENNYAGGLLERIYLYFDGGSSQIKSGLVRFDEFQVAGFQIMIADLSATLIDSSRVQLTWVSDESEHTDHFNIYRGPEASFPADPYSKIGETESPAYIDSGLTNHTTYFYKVSATDTEGREHLPVSVSIRTSTPGKLPTVEAFRTDTTPVATYDKLELLIRMTDATYTNPYDPDEIDLYAWFCSPEGDSVKINGFYDNYHSADQWKIRFAPAMEGEWTYRVFATDMDGTGISEAGSFNAAGSDHHGWLQVSGVNPDYLVHHDGTGFYGMAVYYPWNVTENRLDEFRAVKGNIFGYWDCTYDHEGNGGGRYLLESMESGIGRYDQRKAARIDEVLSWAEERDMKVMLALWVHGFLRIDGVPWDDGHWNEHNPYSTIIEVDEFYTDSLALAYQEKHHRYVIARWGYSRALGIWEIINEIHGTSGWVSDRNAAKKWVERVHTYFREHDPFSRPTTASFGGSEGASHFSENDRLGDMPNVHFYEQHGWPTPFPEDPVRSGLENVSRLARNLKSKGDRPAFLGEAGYYSMLTDVETEGYTWEFHNAFWAGLTSGLATTPFWWEFNKEDIFTPVRMKTYLHLEQFIREIDLARQPFRHSAISVSHSDGSFMGAVDNGFGWLKTHHDSEVADLAYSISGTSLENGTYLTDWYDTWSGEYVATDTTFAVSGLTWGRIPEQMKREDAALRIRFAEPGGAASQIHLRLVASDTLVPGPFPWSPPEDSTLYNIICYVTDGHHQLDTTFTGPLEMEIQAQGLEEAILLHPELMNGGQVLNYLFPDTIPAFLVASIPGIGSDTLYLGGATGPLTHLRAPHTKPLELVSFPNPLQHSTTIAFSLPQSAKVHLAVVNLSGETVEVLDDQLRSPGRHEVSWDAGGYPAGIYFCQLRSSVGSGTLKLVIHP